MAPRADNTRTLPLGHRTALDALRARPVAGASAAAGTLAALLGAAGLAVGEHLHALWPLGSVARDLLSSLVVALPASIVIAGWASRHPVAPVVRLPLERRRIRATAAAV